MPGPGYLLDSSSGSFSQFHELNCPVSPYVLMEMSLCNSFSSFYLAHSTPYFLSPDPVSTLDTQSHQFQINSSYTLNFFIDFLPPLCLAEINFQVSLLKSPLSFTFSRKSPLTNISSYSQQLLLSFYSLYRRVFLYPFVLEIFSDYLHLLIFPTLESNTYCLR